MPEERHRRNTHETHPGRESNQKKPSSNGWQLIAVQSISCLVILLIALVFRLIGGSSFEQLRQSFNQSIMSNSVIATLAALMNTNDANNTDPSSDGSDVSSESSSSATSENASSSTQTNTTEPSQTTSSPSTTAVSQTTAVPAGGKDMPITEKKVLYAPQGATFAPLKINRLAYKPLEKGTISSYFGYRKNPTKGGESFHQALDIAADQGSPIAAMYFGVVSEIGQNSSYGNYVKLYHGNGIEVVYAHCSEILVHKDAVIRAGETVARVGSTGDSTGPHLHIEVRLHGIAYDPAGILPVDAYA